MKKQKSSSVAVPTDANPPKEWPCEICIHISAYESWLVEEILTNVRRSTANFAFNPRSRRNNTNLVSSALRGMCLKLTEI